MQTGYTTKFLYTSTLQTGCGHNSLHSSALPLLGAVVTPRPEVSKLTLGTSLSVVLVGRGGREGEPSVVAFFVHLSLLPVYFFVELFVLETMLLAVRCRAL